MGFMRGRLRAAKENRHHFNPATANGARSSNRYLGRATQSHCGNCRQWYKTSEHSHCPQAECIKKLEAERPQHSIHISNPDAAVTGWYEHIDSKPIYIESRAQLYRECAKRGQQAKALMSGGVMKRPRGA